MLGQSDSSWSVMQNNSVISPTDTKTVVSLQLYTIHVIQAGSSDKTPAIITRRYSDFQRLHSTLCRNYGDQMERVCFPRKCEFT